MAFPTPQWVTDLLAVQTQLALAKTAIDAQTAGNPKSADQALFRAVVNCLEAIQNLSHDDGKSQVPATPDVA